jgi:hypothetical protein
MMMMMMMIKEIELGQAMERAMEYYVCLDFIGFSV